jgi:hypothetical protein
LNEERMKLKFAEVLGSGKVPDVILENIGFRVA